MVVCENCRLSPVVCVISTNGLEMIYCQECIAAVALAKHRLYDIDPPRMEPGDLGLLDKTEKRLRRLVDERQWNGKA